MHAGNIVAVVSESASELWDRVMALMICQVGHAYMVVLQQVCCWCVQHDAVRELTCSLYYCSIYALMYAFVGADRA
jgi:hypothetical protein